MRRIYDTQRWRRLRRTILQRDHYTCHWCGGRAKQADHLKPLALGGNPYDPSNLVAACLTCNSSRGAETAQHIGFLRRGARLTPPVAVRENCSRIARDGARLGAIRV